jgi:hypothetical protein
MSSGEYEQVRRRRRMDWGDSPHTILLPRSPERPSPNPRLRRPRQQLAQPPVDPMQFSVGRRAPTQHTGQTRRIRRQNQSSRPIKAGPYLPNPGDPDPTLIFAPNPWFARCQEPPEHGRIRMLTDPDTQPSHYLRTWWWRDRTLTEWIDGIREATTDVSNNPMVRIVFGPAYPQQITELFYANQRNRWMARKFIQRIRQRIWSRRPACNMDLIEMTPVIERDAIHITDTINRRVFRFHRRDLLNTVMSNLTMSDEFMPTPRHPTNPWTNEPFTRAQTMAVCNRLAADFVKRGHCPPPLLSAFWAAGFNIKRFQRENSAVLSQHAIQNYFRDINDDTFTTIFETMTTLLDDAGCDFSPLAVRRWLRETPITSAHREWLALCRDYTLFLNLHVQARASWFTTEGIYRDIRAAWSRTQMPPVGAPPARLRVVRGQTATVVPVAPFSFPPSPPRPPLTALLTLPTTLPPPTDAVQGLLSLMLPPLPVNIPSAATTTATDLSGTEMSLELALQLIQDGLFRL